MNYLDYLEQEGKSPKKYLSNMMEGLLLGYGTEQLDENQFQNMVSLLYNELKKIKDLPQREIVEAYKEMMRNYTKYRRFTISGYLTALFELRK